MYLPNYLATYHLPPIHQRIQHFLLAWWVVCLFVCFLRIKGYGIPRAGSLSVCLSREKVASPRHSGSCAIPSSLQLQRFQSRQFCVLASVHLYISTIITTTIFGWI
ncbi:hypothetical protein GGR58DRAFT_419609 [Xylaria digitata]|nr:hypothetical protein GGR58DRAFT_419609 [Xylaria digitata]